MAIAVILAALALAGAGSTVWLNTTRAGLENIETRPRYRRVVETLALVAAVGEWAAGVWLVTYSATAALMMLLAFAANAVVLCQCHIASKAGRSNT